MRVPCLEEMREMLVSNSLLTDLKCYIDFIHVMIEEICTNLVFELFSVSKNF